jgi:phage shock protein E
MTPHLNLRRRLLRAALLGNAIIFAAACGGADAPRPSAAQVHEAYDNGTVFVDVRTDAEWSAGHVKNAVHLPVDQVGARAASVLPAKDKPVVLYCGTGRRAQSAAESLRQLGYTNVTAMTGGYADLKAAGFPVVE